jgi:hypothetical protein
MVLWSYEEQPKNEEDLQSAGRNACATFFCATCG